MGSAPMSVLDDLGDSPDLSAVLAIVSQSTVPMLVLEIPSQVILAASPGAHELLDDPTAPVIGRSFEAFTEGRASGAMSLLAECRINAYETTEILRPSGRRRRLRITELPSDGLRRRVLAVFEEKPADGVSRPSDVPAGPIFGSADAGLLVEAISSSVFESLGYRTTAIVGTSLLALIAPENLADVLSALGRIPEHDEGLTLRVGVVRADGVPVRSQLVLLPRSPAPSCAFALMLESAQEPADARAIAGLITRLGQDLGNPSASPAVTTRTLHTAVELARLSGREIEVVTLLVAGDRVPKIAKRLFLSEGTVRNNLSSVFGKLRVANQQELIDLFRPASQLADQGARS